MGSTNDSKSRISYTCPHSIYYKSQSTGKRKVAPNKYSACPVIININEKDDKTFKVTKVVLEHQNHEVGKEVYDQYVRSKRLTGEQENAVRSYLETEPTSKEVAKLLKYITGKSYSIQNARNIVTKLKSKPK